jgi:hypothetical protein
MSNMLLAVVLAVATRVRHGVLRSKHWPDRIRWAMIRLAAPVLHGRWRFQLQTAALSAFAIALVVFGPDKWMWVVLFLSPDKWMW